MMYRRLLHVLIALIFAFAATIPVSARATAMTGDMSGGLMEQHCHGCPPHAGSVDPARDTPSRLASYLENFDSRIVGLTGTDAQVAAAAKAYAVYYSTTDHEKSGTDAVSHSTFVYLMNPSGAFNAVLPPDVDAPSLAKVLRSKISQGS
jgi:hypothetical protein